MEILNKIKEAQLLGRGGASFPVATKWDLVKKADSQEKYVICNASEGEPGVAKDGYILEKHSEHVINGMRLARKYLQFKDRQIKVKSYLYINYTYFAKFKEDLEEFIRPEDEIEFFIKPEESGYIGGEETSILNVIEGDRAEPRIKPPFPNTEGLNSKPTIINNVETFYNISLVNRGEYKGERYFTLGGKIRNKGVYCLPEKRTIKKILEETGNQPKFPFFVQTGGDASGLVLNSDQLSRQVEGSGSITVYKLKNNPPKKIFKKWLDFYVAESCGQCTPCREGMYQLRKILDQEKANWHLFRDLLKNLERTSFCGLGSALPVPIFSYVKNIIEKTPAKILALSEAEKKRIIEAFK